MKRLRALWAPDGHSATRCLTGPGGLTPRRTSPHRPDNRAAKYYRHFEPRYPTANQAKPPRLIFTPATRAYVLMWLHQLVQRLRGANMRILQDLSYLQTHKKGDSYSPVW
ncbi:hypothetical protein GGTG_11391 [Gaeumannomyces tritici R3-111a-1]|uniref:Uncharacterized protein n=1 Tax=Gaeumannomyces tritici (strain R3-111a-1) TaxID=644352 RepID=J3PD18_GAET3|nr:hypothetical protein GGTG_11391 [Gaeumannomyces tritici R3-111a-1]EJT70363.1 hypothetical protein GGTG_11391 [Gaeumannomyces tritici R3-111a-1]